MSGRMASSMNSNASIARRREFAARFQVATQVQCAKVRTSLAPAATQRSRLFIEANVNICVRPRSSSKFVNMNTGRRGLVAQYDVICFDEVSGVSFDQKEGVNILKGYM